MAHSAESQQDSLTARDSVSQGFLPLPIIFYAPENGFALGGALLYVTRQAADPRPSTWVGQLIYTTKNQVIVELQEDIYLAHGLFRADGAVHYSRYPQKFFGVGNNIPDGQSEEYSSNTSRAYLDVVRKVTDQMNLGVTTFYESKTVTETEPMGMLAAGTISGSSGGRTVGAGLLWSWDTRDNVFSSYSGSYHLVDLKFFSPTLGSDFEYTRLSVNLRTFFELASRQILALQANGILINGTPAFHKLAELGGQNMMRGYYQGRYNDKNLLAFQSEFRFPLWRLFSGALFAAVGDVASRLSAFNLPDVKLAYGAGVRYTFDERERLVLRLDLGFAGSGSNLYIAAIEAF